MGTGRLASGGLALYFPIELIELSQGGWHVATNLDDVTRAMLEAIPLGVIVLEPDGGDGGRVAFANRRATALVGRELAGRRLAEAVAADADAGADAGAASPPRN